MEYLYLFIASSLAGIGTGLSGLSAATVMVPILVVLCPSFSGPTGAYQATAVALISDILASAFTTTIYIKNKNIDLRRGSIMLVCILVMSTIGSYVAYLVGNVVLGSFSIFLTFFIGIRFLVKPDTGNPEASEVESKGFTLKEILISLFFGITIGFGTGFVGTGGGMMMLLVFTLFLKMGQRTAVGTSTFIMTFTALIAGISHIIIDPGILTYNSHILIFCVIITALFSIGSARFANKVDKKVVGITTGVVLTLLGLSMLILFYWPTLSQYISTSTFFAIFEFISILALYILVILGLKKVINIPQFIFRKLLHLVAVFCPVLLSYLSSSWIMTDFILFIFGLGAFVILKCFEDLPNFSKFFAQKQEGEILRSLVEYILTAIILVTITWGIAGKFYILIASYLMWGIGDACAAIIGKYFGKKKLRFKFADKNKTYLGSLSMFIIDSIIGYFVLYFLSSLSVISIILYTAIASLVGTYVEAICHKGMDTIFVPISIALILLI